MNWFTNRLVRYEEMMRKYWHWIGISLSLVRMPQIWPWIRLQKDDHITSSMCILTVLLCRTSKQHLYPKMFGIYLLLHFAQSSTLVQAFRRRVHRRKVVDLVSCRSIDSKAWMIFSLYWLSSAHSISYDNDILPFENYFQNVSWKRSSSALHRLR